VSLRLIAAAVIFTVLLATHWKAYTVGGKHVRNEWAAATAKANDEARTLERARQSAADAAGRLAAAAASRDRDRLRGANRELLGMRDTLDAIERASEESHDAATKHVAALRAVFGECSAEVVRLAEEAAGHARDSLMYQRSWPK
jgi:hypothetical protein